MYRHSFWFPQSSECDGRVRLDKDIIYAVDILRLLVSTPLFERDTEKISMTILL